MTPTNALRTKRLTLAFAYLIEKKITQIKSGENGAKEGRQKSEFLRQSTGVRVRGHDPCRNGTYTATDRMQVRAR